MTYNGDPDAPSCPECTSSETERHKSDAGSSEDYLYHCLNCDTAFEEPDKPPES